MVKNRILVLIITIVAIWSCEPCADCGEPLLYEPNVRVTFINLDSLKTLTDSLDKTDSLISIFEKHSDDLRTKTNSLTSQLRALRDSIENGKQQYAKDSAIVFDSIGLVSGELALADTSLKKTRATQSELTADQQRVLSGKVRVNQIDILENSGILTYDDSIETYVLPLLMQDFSVTTYKIQLGEDTDTLSFTYLTDLYVDAERKVKMRAFNIDTLTNGHTYDSLTVVCNTDECLDNEVFVTVYF